MFKKNLQLILGILIGAIIFATLNVIADDNSIYAVISSVKIKLNGNPIALQNPVLNYNGRTYLPVRELSTTIGKSILYDADSNTISIGDVANNNTPIVTQANSELINKENARHEKALKEIDESYNKTKTYIQNKIAQKKANSTLYYGSDSDYNKELTKEQGKLLALQKEYNSYMMDNSLEGQSVKTAISKKIAAQQEVVNNLQSRYSAKVIVASLEEMYNKNETEHNQKITDENNLHEKNIKAISSN